MWLAVGWDLQAESMRKAIQFKVIGRVFRPLDATIKVSSERLYRMLIKSTVPPFLAKRCAPPRILYLGIHSAG